MGCASLTAVSQGHRQGPRPSGLPTVQSPGCRSPCTGPALASHVSPRPAPQFCPVRPPPLQAHLALSSGMKAAWTLVSLEMEIRSDSLSLAHLVCSFPLRFLVGNDQASSPLSCGPSWGSHTLRCLDKPDCVPEIRWQDWAHVGSTRDQTQADKASSL